MRSSNGAFGFRAALALGALVLLIGGGCRTAAEAPTIQVYKTATCGCCTKWIEHLEAAGFDVEALDLPDLASLKTELTSCHTAIVEGYVLEGHVPAADVERLLSERPAIQGLAVPEMPLGSPGMEHPDPSRHQPYDVLSFGPDGVRVYASHPAAS
jgi:hypothetical protein